MGANRLSSVHGELGSDVDLADAIFWTILTTVAFGLAAVAILINRQARLAMRLMALMLTLFGALVWLLRIVAHPGLLSDWSEFSANYLMAAASWLVADVRAF
ncbi:MAG: hypothetical protein WCB99_13880 [Candidatus Cybelea sp.]